MSNKSFTYELKIDAEINQLVDKANKAKKSMQSIMDAGKAPGAEKIFGSIERAIDKIREKASQPITSVAAFTGLQKDAAAITAQLSKLGGLIEELGNLSDTEKIELLPQDFQKRIYDAQTAVANFTKAFSAAQEESEDLARANRDLAKANEALKKANDKLGDATALAKADETAAKAAKQKTVEIQRQVEVLKKYQTTLAAYEKAGGDKSASGDAAANKGKGLEKFNIGADRAAASKAAPGVNLESTQEVAAALAKLNEELRIASKLATAAENQSIKSGTALSVATTEAARAQAKVADLEGSVETLNAEFEENKVKNIQAAFEQLRTQAQALGVSLTDIPTEYTEENLEQLNQALLRIKQEGIEQVTTNLQTFETQTEETTQALGGLQNQLALSQEKFVQMDNTVRSTQAFAQRISQFVGLEGAAQLARRALRDVIATVKDLDEAMTEMAVVTDLDVGDYWDQLPEYTTRANELGVSIKSAYEAATLFYQQGLKTNEVVEISNETLKMARIAGLSAEDATNKMTAALRGFNMELNETSAQKVSDVYSQLAAITASDVKEISSAMTKTASIASSAGMEFETTAAFLSQIIETTRESAETAGTAMKTVIARFQELKKSPSEIGEIDGEIVDANKIEAALRTVGVSLRDSQGQFRDLDEVFLELANKWDDLDTNTQRYIATIAAGSRQQSRFIAMMSDYGRTQELVSAANNSAGASNKQFEKTLDSLESKINQLNNAWDTFTMGLMSDELVKFGVDLLTKIITLLDKATGAFEGLGGAIGKVGLVLTVFKIGKVLLDKFIITVQERFREAGIKASGGFKEGFKEGLNGTSNETKSTDSSQEEGFSVIGKTDKNKKPQMFGKTREAMHSGLSNLGAASQSLSESQNYFKQADAHEASAQKLNAQGDAKVGAGVAKIGAEFKKKMSQMTGDTKKADEAWKKYVNDLKKGGKQGYAAIQAMNKELEETADLNDSLDEMDPENPGIPTSDEMKRLEGWTESFKEITQGNEDLAEAAKNTAEAESEREEATRLAAQADKQSQEGMTQLGTAMSTVGQTAIGIGVGLTALGGALESMGLEGAAEGFSKVSTVLSIFGTVLMALPPIIKLLGLTFSSTGVQISIAGFTAQLGWWPFVLILLAVVAAVALLVAGFVLLSKNTPEAKLRAAEEAAQAAADAAKESKEAFEELQNTFENYKDMRDSLDDLEEGTLEWKNAMLELNSVVLELLTLYPQLAQYVKMGDSGILTISDEGMKNMLDVASQGAQNMATVAAMAQMAVIDQKQTMLKDNSDFETARSTARGQGTVYSGTTDSARLNELDQKLKEGTFDFSARTITKEDLSQLSEEELHQLYDQQYNYKGYAETFDWNREDFEKTLGSSIDYYGEMTLYSKDLYDYTEGYAYGMSQMVAYQKDYNEELKQNIQYDMQRQNLMQSAITSQLDANVQAAGYGKAIVESLSQVESLDLGQMKEDIAADNQGNKSDDRNLWGNGGNGTNDALKEALGERGLSATGDEKKDLQAYYKSLSGIEYDYSEDGKAADDIMAEKIAEAEAAEKLGSYVNEMYETAEASKYLDEVLSNDLDVDVDSAKEEINSLKVATEESAEGISEVAKSALSNALNNIEKERAKIDARLGEVFSEGFKFNTDGAYKMAQEFFSVYDMMSGYAGEATAILFADAVESMNDALANGDLSESDFRDKMNSFLDVSWDSAIDGAAALKEMLEGDDAGLKDFATKLLLIEDSAYSATAQMNEFYNSLSSDALKELAADGEITATEILELAKSNEKLATMMDTTGVSAATLGNYYELLESGVMSAYEATNEFIIALDKLNAASNTIENAFGFIDTFEPSRSQTEISDYFAEMRESAMSLYDIGAYGDQQLKDYINAFLGDSNWQAIIDKNNGDMQAAIDEAMAQINSYGENLYGTWQTLVEQGLQGVSMGEDGSIQFDMTQIGDLEQLKQQIMDMGWSEAMADALLADAQTFSAELSNGLDQLGISAAFESWLSGALSINGKTIIPKSQVEAMAKELGTTVEKLTEDLKAEGIEVSELITSDGLLSKDMREQLIADAEAAGEFDLETNYQLLLELGLDDAAAKAELKTMANSLTDMPMKINGQTITQTAGVLYDSTGVAIEGGSTGGLIDSLVDPKVKAAQELSAIEQGEMMAKANATGSIVASRIALQASAEGIDNLINGAIDILNYIPGVNISKSNLAGSVAKDTDKLVNSASAQIENRNKSAKNQLNKTINSSTTDGGNVSNAVTNLTDKYTKDTASVISSYNNKKAQETGVVQEEIEAWENPYDELYNLNHKLNAQIREREKLERDYERAVEDSSKSAQDLADITAQELASLKEEAKVQKDIARAALKNIEMERAENTQYSQYYTYDTKTNTIQVDWEAVDKAGWNADEGAEFEDFISYLEDQADTAKEAQDALDDIEDSVDEIQKRGRDSTSEIYNQVKEGLIKERQDEIDKLQAINDSIQEAQSALVDQIQKQIDDARQARDNEKAENDIADKETRLAYLMRDTSGGNALEIASLQKEIEEAKTSHTDSLVDQQLQELQEANDKAAEQRQQQIDLAQGQLDAYANSAEIWSEVKGLVDAGFQLVAQGVPFAETEAGKLALLGEEVESMNPFEKEDFKNELEYAAKEGAIYEGLVKVTGEDGATTISEMSAELTSAIGELKTESGQAADNKTRPGNKQAESEKEETTVTTESEVEVTEAETNEKELPTLVKGLPPASDNISPTPTVVPIINNGGYTSTLTLRNKHFLVTQAMFKQGGLADFTGPAWLDGTKSKPEIVLNQTDSANFMQLRDILADILNGTSGLSKSNPKEKGGDNYYDIEINVESISDDYDVEQLADKIRSMIYDDAVYRNVNSINNIR